MTLNILFREALQDPTFLVFLIVLGMAWAGQALNARALLSIWLRNSTWAGWRTLNWALMLRCNFHQQFKKAETTPTVMECVDSMEFNSRHYTNETQTRWKRSTLGQHVSRLSCCQLCRGNIFAFAYSACCGELRVRSEFWLHSLVLLPSQRKDHKILSSWENP